MKRNIKTTKQIFLQFISENWMPGTDRNGLKNLISCFWFHECD